MAIQLIPISINKENRDLRGFEFNNAVIAPQTVLQAIAIEFPALNSNQVGRFNLSNEIDCDLLVKNIDIDIKHDDSKDITSAKYHAGNTPLIFFLKDPETDKLVRKLTPQVSGYPAESFYFILRRNLIIEIKPSAGFDSLILYCEPIYISNTITAQNLNT